MLKIVDGNKEYRFLVDGERTQLGDMSLFQTSLEPIDPLFTGNEVRGILIGIYLRRIEKTKEKVPTTRKIEV